MEKPGRRVTLRQLLLQAEKSTQDLIQLYRAQLAGSLAEFREACRPVRRRSSYPTLQTIRQALKKLQAANEEAGKRVEQLHKQLLEIRERAKREQANRSQ